MHFLIKLLTTFAVIFLGCPPLRKSTAITLITTLMNIATIKPPIGAQTQMPARVQSSHILMTLTLLWQRAESLSWRMCWA